MATANLTDMSILATDSVFGNRVLESLVLFCWSTVPGESITSATVGLHAARKNYSAAVLNNPAVYKPLFINAVSTNQTVANEATAGGTLVGLTPTQVATAAAACLDADINNAVAAAFNAFIQGI
jgi:hypothetical protein